MGVTGWAFNLEGAEAWTAAQGENDFFFRRDATIFVAKGSRKDRGREGGTERGGKGDERR